MQNLKHLAGKLELIEIHRPGIENGIAQSCENCGRTILNFAKVSYQGKTYTIGTDCAKTLCNKEGAKAAKGFELWRERIEFFTKQPFEFKFVRNSYPKYVDVFALTKSKTNGLPVWALVDAMKDNNATFPEIYLSENPNKK